MLTVGATWHQGGLMIGCHFRQVAQNIVHKALHDVIELLCQVKLCGLLDILGGDAIVHILPAFAVAGFDQYFDHRDKAVAYLAEQAFHFCQVDFIDATVGGNIFCRTGGNHPVFSL